MSIEKCLHEINCSGCVPNEQRFHIFNAAREFFRSCGYEGYELIDSVLTGWRTRAKLAVRRSGNRLKIGLFTNNTHTVVCIPHCCAHHDSINQVVEKIAALSPTLGYDETSHSGDLRYIQVTVERQTGCAQVVFVLNCDPADQERRQQWRKIAQKFHREDERLFHSVYLNYQKEATNRILGEEFELVLGEPFLYERISGGIIPIAPSHFTQAHPQMFERLLEDLVSHIEPGESLIELYAGMGVISLVAAPFCKSVLAIEKEPGSKQAFLAAVAFLPPSEREKLRFLVGDAEKGLEAIGENDSILVDPPRKGLSSSLIAKLASAHKIYYISCHFPSLQRDLELFFQNNFYVDFARAYRFFPGTEHIETLVVLRLRN